MLQQLVIGVDASPESFEALRLRLVNAGRLDRVLGAGEAERAHRAGARLAAADTSRDIRLVDRVGDPVTVLAKAAREAGAPLVVLGHPRPESAGARA